MSALGYALPLSAKSWRRQGRPSQAEVELAKTFDDNDPLFLAWCARAEIADRTNELKQRACIDLEGALKQAEALRLPPESLAAIRAAAVQYKTIAIETTAKNTSAL
jgi:hypothetical protein